MLISRKIGEMFKFPGFVNIDYLLEKKIYVSPSRILNALTRDWRKYVRPVGFREKDLLDPTFGYETKGGTDISIGSYIRGSIHACPESGTGNSITVYVYIPVPSFMLWPAVKCALYDANENLVTNGVTEEKTYSSGYDNWDTFNFPTSPSLSAQDYIMVAWGFRGHYVNSPPKVYYDSETAKGRSQSLTYDSFPDPASFDVEDRKYSIYCTYAAAVGTIAIHAKLVE